MAFSQNLTKDPVATRYAAQITEEDLRDKLSILASDALEGRMVGTRGQKMAAAFIRHHFESAGLKGPVNGGFFQPVILTETKPGEHSLMSGSETFADFSDHFYMGSADSNGPKSAPLSFIGSPSAQDLEKLNVSGKAALLFAPDLEFDHFRDFYKTAETLRGKGALAVLISPSVSDEEFTKKRDMLKEWVGNGNLSLEKDPDAGMDVFFVRRSLAARLMGTSAEKLNAAITKGKMPKDTRISWINRTVVSEVASENVLGYLEGTDKKDELVIVTAHFDHVGTTAAGEGSDRIFNGADDDGSGTSAVVELAETFAAAAREGVRPRRSMLFMTVTAEEEGLFGSEHYVRNPVFPLDKTVVDLNIDMIGRSDPQHQDNPAYVYAIGSDKLSAELHQLHESVNRTYSQLQLDYTYNDEKHPERLYYRSDHWNFAKNNVPIIFYFDGIHEDYHKVSDEVSKIDFKSLTARTRLVFHTAWEIANREKRIMPDSK